MGVKQCIPVINNDVYLLCDCFFSKGDFIRVHISKIKYMQNETNILNFFLFVNLPGVAIHIILYKRSLFLSYLMFQLKTSNAFIQELELFVKSFSHSISPREECLSGL